MKKMFCLLFFVAAECFSAEVFSDYDETPPHLNFRLPILNPNGNRGIGTDYRFEQVTLGGFIHRKLWSTGVSHTYGDAFGFGLRAEYYFSRAFTSSWLVGSSAFYGSGKIHGGDDEYSKISDRRTQFVVFRGYFGGVLFFLNRVNIGASLGYYSVHDLDIPDAICPLYTDSSDCGTRMTYGRSEGGSDGQETGEAWIGFAF